MFFLIYIQVGYNQELERAASGSMDATVRIWCCKTGVALYNLEGIQFDF